MLEWDTIVLSTVLSGIIAGVIAYMFRYHLKPKHEQVFETNRKSDISRIFDSLHYLEFRFESFLDIFEKEMGKITKTRTRVLDRPKWVKQADGSSIATMTLKETQLQTKYQKLKEDLKSDVVEFEKGYNSFLENYRSYITYIESSFLKNVIEYFWTTLYFSSWALKDSLLPNLLVKRIKLAEKIIDFVENDKSIDLEEPTINDFLQEAKKSIGKLKILNS